MVTQYDEKGKIFTQVISKDPVEVVIQMNENLIHGTVHVRRDTRLKDELNGIGDRFFAVTEAIVYNMQREELYRCNFLVINIDQVVWIMPKEEIIP